MASLLTREGREGGMRGTNQPVLLLGHLLSGRSLYTTLLDVKQLVMKVLYRGLWLIAIAIRCMQRTVIVLRPSCGLLHESQ